MALIKEEIESSSKKVIASGSFVTISRDSNLLSFTYEKEKFNFIFSFSVNQNTSASSINYQPDPQTNSLRLDFINFENALGVATLKPIEVAQSKDKKVYLHVLVHSINQDTKSVAYTFYVDK